VSTDYKKLGAEKLELKAAWEHYELPGEFPSKEVALWLVDYGKDMVESGFKVLATKSGKVDSPVSYLGTYLRNSKLQNMTPEEREADISHKRSMVGKIGAAKRHKKEISYIKDEFAKAIGK
jgi:hypothetical protein